MEWKLDICGEEGIDIPAPEKCNECDIFEERLTRAEGDIDTLETTVAGLPEYVAGTNVTFTDNGDGTTSINSSGGGGGTTYTAGNNIQISAANVISATDTTYTAGDGIDISASNVVSADVRRQMISDAETSPAAGAHAVGEYLIYNNTLYRVKTAIAAGDALVVNTNIMQTSIGDELRTTLLWTNPNPNADFGAQSIALDLSRYSFVEVYASDDVYAKAEIGTGCNLVIILASITVTGVRASTRWFKPEADRVTFDTAYLVSQTAVATAVANRLKPLKIYGVV